MNDLNNITNEITILGNYINSKEKFKIKCNKCSYEWGTYPYNLLRGHGCLKCTGIYKKTTEIYKKS